MKIQIITYFLILPNFILGQSISLNTVITKLLTEKDFSGTVFIEKADTVLYHNSFGLANHQFNIPNTNETRYHIASITKLFTSVLIFELFDMGKINLKETIKTYLPKYTGEGAETVTIDQLLTHTSGIQNCEEIGSDVEVLRMPNTSDNILEKYCSGGLIFQPGTKFSYNNADYIILGKIIEELYNKSFEQVLSERILQPLNLVNSGMIDNSVINNLAYAYIWDSSKNEYNNNPTLILGNYFSAGAMYSTANDLFKFSDALFHGDLISKNALNLMLQTSSSSDYWAHGLEVLTLNYKEKEYKSAYRQGGCQGTNTSINYFFDDDLTIIILANTNKIPSQEFKELNKAIDEIILN